LELPRAEAKAIIEGYFASYPKVKEYMDYSAVSAREKGYVETIFGRRRYLNDISSRNAVARGLAERNAINAPIQGSAADIIKIAMIRIYERMQREGLQARMILQVHDELNFDVPVGELEQLSRLVTEEMQQAYQLSVPLIADSGVADNWLEAH
jgi:DNA polymerase-1